MKSISNQKLQPIEDAIIEYQKLFLRDLKLPVRASLIKQHFADFQKKIYPNLRVYFPDQEDSIDELDCLLEKRILVNAEIQNCQKLEDLYKRNVDNYIENYNLRIKQDWSSLSSFIHANIGHSDDVLNKLPAHLMLLDKGKKNEAKSLKEVNDSVELCLNLAHEFIKSLFEKYELKEYYLCKKDSITNSFQEKLLDKFKKTFPLEYQTIIQTLEKFYSVCEERILAIQTENKNIISSDFNIKYWISIYHSLRKVELADFIDSVRNQLKFEPLSLLSSQYVAKIEKQMEFIHQKIFFLRDDFEYIKNVVYEPLSNLFKEYYMTSECQIFDSKTFDSPDLVTIAEILRYSDVGIEDSTWESLYFPKIVDLISNFIQPNLDSSSKEYVQSLFSKTSDSMEEEKEKDQMEAKPNPKLVEAKGKWASMMIAKKSKIFLPTLFGIFIYLSNSLRNTKDQQYLPLFRKIITRLFRNFSNAEDRYTNFQLLTIMECMYEEYQRLSQPKMDLEDEKSQKSSDFKNKITELAKQKNSLESVITVENLLELEEFAPKNIEKPSKFYIERINQFSAVRSKHIIVAVSGWTSELMKKTEYWSAMVQANPFTEIHAVHYESQNEQYVFGNILNKVSNTINTFDTKKFVANTQRFGKLISFGIAAFEGYTKYKELLGDTWEKAYKEAIRTGTYLAHVLNEADYYKGKTITLVGFSLGTLGVSCCLWELERLKRYDLLYEVLLMGGAASTRDFRGSNLRIISHDLINCYTNNDSVLKYILRAADITADPVGLSDISTSARNVRNYNLTDLVTGHMDFRPKMKNIIEKVDFNEDLLYMFRE